MLAGRAYTLHFSDHGSYMPLILSLTHWRPFDEVREKTIPRHLPG